MDKAKQLYVNMKLQDIMFKLVMNGEYNSINQFLTEKSKNFIENKQQDLEQVLPLYGQIKDQLDQNLVEELQHDIEFLKEKINNTNFDNDLSVASLPQHTKNAYIKSIVRLTKCSIEEAEIALEQHDWKLADATFKIYDTKQNESYSFSNTDDPEFIIEI